MQTLTFTQKLFRQRRYLSSFIPLLALFIGLGASQTVQAQSTIASNSVDVVLKQGTSGFPATYNTNTASSGASNFAGRNFGSFDISADAFILNGGTLTINEDAASGDAFDQGELLFRVFPGTLSTTTGIPVFQRIQLTNNGVSNGVRSFSLSNANKDLLALVTTAGSPGTSYRFDVQFVATDNSGGTILPSPVRRSVFTATGVRPAPTNIGNSNVFINFNNSTVGNVTYGASSGTTPLFQGNDLGLKDINTGNIILNGGNVTTFESFGDVVQGARLIYRIIKPAQNGKQAIIFPTSQFALVQVGTPTAANGGTTRTFSNTTAFRNLVSGLANSDIGTYNVTVSYEADVLRANGTVEVLRDDNNGTVGYRAIFTLNGVPIPIDTWTGAVNDDWFNGANWDLGRIPDANTNVVVPDFGVGNTKPYPNINAGVAFTASNAASVDNSNSGPALSRDVDLQGSTQAQRSITRLVNGRWRVFGSFSNTYDSYIQRQGALLTTVFELAGSGNQAVSGGTFVRAELSGGGTKNLTGIMTVSSSVTFLPNGGLLTTDISNPDKNYVELGNRSVDAVNGAQLIGETDVAYIRGFVRTVRTDVRTGELDANGNPDPRTFGNLGVTLFFTGVNNPGDIVVTRNTAESYTPLVQSATTGTATERYGIRRIFGVRPSFGGALEATMTFRYLDTELTNLGPKGNGSVGEPNLILFVSTSGGNQFSYLGADALDQTNNVLTKTQVRTFATFTLGDKTNPLPVSLIAFDAKRTGADALLTWKTASERNSKGFDVQVSTDGKAFRTLGFVASETPNSDQLRSYSYVDVEKNKAGQRYYRLRQVDVNGKETFFVPRLVTFDGKAVAPALAAYPNPFGNADKLHLTLQSALAGQGRMTITDMTGRTVSQQQVDLSTGSNDMLVNGLSELKGGLYMVRFVLPTGELQSLKVQKQ